MRMTHRNKSAAALAMIGSIAALTKGRNDLPNAFGPSKGSTPNKYKPHQGKQECERRLRQVEAGRMRDKDFKLCPHAEGAL